MIKSFYVFENTLYSNLTAIGSDFINKDEELEKIIGFKPKDYNLTVYSRGNDFQLSFREEFIADVLNLYRGDISHALFIGSYGWEHNVDESEINYINIYFSDENKKTVKLLINLLDANITLNESEWGEEIGMIFSTLDGIINVSDIINEISEAESDAIINHVKHEFEKLPIDISIAYSSVYDIDIEFNVNDIGEYIDENNLQDIDTVADFLRSLDFSEFGEDMENVSEYRDEMDFSKIQKKIQEELEKVIDLFEEYYISVPKDDDPKLFKDNEIEKNPKYKLPYGIFSKLDFNNIEYAKNIGGRVLAWYKSYIFQKQYMKDPSLEKYENLINNDILNPKIEEEYGYLKGIEDFNL